jgi:thiamine-monophosphate kinase
MKLGDIGEFGFIRRMARGCLIQPADVVRAIGDDAAAFVPASGRLVLFTTDMLVERVHFLRDGLTGDELGHKSLAVNLSDIAGMGGTAHHAFVSIAIPEDCPVEYLDALYDGMKALAAVHQVNILGGDTTASKRDLIISVAVIGSVAESEMLLRSRAGAGDVVVTTGTLGDSRAGFHLMRQGASFDRSSFRELRRAHVMPMPHLHEGRFLAQSGAVTAAIDVSDGLSSDLGHLIGESRVGVRLHADRIPMSDALREVCREASTDPIQWALDGGEDYVLLCTVSAGRAAALCDAFAAAFARPLHRIGEIVDEPRMEMVLPDGTVRPFTPGGWDHFVSGKRQGACFAEVQLCRNPWVGRGTRESQERGEDC